MTKEIPQVQLPKREPTALEQLAIFMNVVGYYGISFTLIVLGAGFVYFMDSNAPILVNLGKFIIAIIMILAGIYLEWKKITKPETKIFEDGSSREQ